MYNVDTTFDHTMAWEESGEICFALVGKPIPMERSRWAYGHMYNSQKKIQEQLKACIKKIMAEKGVLESPIIAKRSCKLEMEATFFLASTGSKSPDVDNLCKFIMDACNGVIYRDDIQVFRLVATKIPRKTTSDVGRTVIKIREWKT